MTPELSVRSTFHFLTFLFQFCRHRRSFSLQCRRSKMRCELYSDHFILSFQAAGVDVRHDGIVIGRITIEHTGGALHRQHCRSSTWLVSPSLGVIAGVMISPPTPDGENVRPPSYQLRTASVKTSSNTTALFSFDGDEVANVSNTSSVFTYDDVAETSKWCV